MCNLYALRASPDDLSSRFSTDATPLGNQPDLPSIFPGTDVPIVRAGPAGAELVRSRWGWPHWKKGARPLTNVRNTDSSFWRPWITRTEHRCLVPFTSFAEYHPSEKTDRGHKAAAWFAAGEDRPILAFAGIARPAADDDGDAPATVHAFLTTNPNAEVEHVHPKAMPAILRTEEEFEIWLQGTTTAALALQRPLPDGTLDVVSLGPKHDADA